jgi:hypothetical protein
MLAIDLPRSRCTRLATSAVLLLGSTLVLFSQAQWSWRLACIGVLLAGGQLLLRHHRRRQPVGLLVQPDGDLRCVLPDGRWVRIAHCQLGIVRPWLASARLSGEGEECIELFVPGCAVPRRVHWELRRALIGFRPRRTSGPG